ncbi:MAG: hypothetical protein J6X97_09090 [Lachnospiraceae bacterium]|nr:hypothetical protein [Lachnospiraceae bacterium]
MKNNKKDDDMDVLQFARKISMLPINTAISNKYDLLHGQQERRWWSCQREHLTIWALHYPTNGTPGFTHKPSNSAKSLYNHFGRPETLLWLSESLGEKPELLNLIISEMEKNNTHTAAFVRKYIPFSRIQQLIEQNA